MTELITASSASLRPLLVSSCTSSTRSYSTLSTFYLHQRLPRPCSSLTTGTRLHNSVVPLVSRVRAVPQGEAFAVEEEEEEEEDDDEDEDEDEDEDGDLSLYEEELGFDDEVDDEGGIEQDVVSGGAKVKKTFRLLGNKEKKELRAYAHSLGNDICLHQIGKWGLTSNCVTAISDALEANELIKIRVLDNLDEELDDTVQAVEMKTGAQIVGRIGRTLLLYRPSIRKLKAAQPAEEKAFKTQRRRSSTTSPRWKSKSSSGASRGRR